MTEKMLKTVGVKYDFPDFTVVFKGSERFDLAPITVSGVEDKFIITDKNGDKKELSVVSGQVPPEPVNFTVNNKKFVLYIYKKDEALYPQYFKIEEI